MKKILLIPAIAVFFLSSCVSNPEGEKAETSDSVEVTDASIEGDLHTVDTENSSLVWTGSKVTGQHTGTVDIKEGALYTKEGQIVGGNFVLDLTTINTTDMQGEYKDKLDAHLKDADFFDVTKYPTATFQITSVEADAAEEGKLKVSGNLTIKDIVKNISFDANVTEATDSTIKVSADFNIVRGDWGVNYEGKKDDLISKEINFKLSLTANRTAE